MMNNETHEMSIVSYTPHLENTIRTVDLPNFEHLPYFEHDVNKQFVTLQLLNPIHQPKHIFVN